MYLFTLCNLIAAFVQGYRMLRAARMVACLAHGVLFPIGAMVAKSLVERPRSPQAVALMFAGPTVGMLVGGRRAYPWIVPRVRQGQNLDDIPNLKRWFEAIKSRSVTIAAYARGEPFASRPTVTEEGKKVLFGQTAANGCASPQPDNKPLKTRSFRWLFADRIRAWNVVRGSVVEAAGGKSQRKAGRVGCDVMTQL